LLHLQEVGLRNAEAGEQNNDLAVQVALAVGRASDDVQGQVLSLELDLAFT